VTAISESAVNISPVLRFISIHFTLTAYLAAAVGLSLFLLGVRLFARKRSLVPIPTSTVYAASPGRTAISGKATGPYTLSAPITGQNCYVSRTTVWQQNKSGGKAEWTKVAEETLHLPFFIKDSSGQLLVEPLGAGFDLQAILSEKYGLPSSSVKPENIPPNVNTYLVRHGIPVNLPTRIEERALQPDMRLFIAGTVVKNPGIEVRPLLPVEDDTPRDNIPRGTAGNFATPAVRPEIVKLAGGPAPSSTMEMTQQGKIAAALNRAGITGPEGWTVTSVRSENVRSENARSEGVPGDGVAVEDRAQPVANSTPELRTPARDQTRAQTKDRPKEKDQSKDANPESASAFNLSPPLVLMKGANNAPFMISCQGQPGAAGSLGWASVVMVVGGTGLTLLGVCMLLFEQQMR
jgi:hypothetical protein